jgi:glycine/D-amino acid oxidase-like deaminating enzyme
MDSVVIDSALSVFPNGADSESKSPYRAFHAAFSVTPDNLPLAGAVPQVPGLFLAAAIWITQAAGVARLVADIVSEKLLLERDVELKDAFNPMRFEGQDQEGLNVRALATYNNIYNKNNHP